MTMRMSGLLENPQKYRDIALAGQKFVKENLSWKGYANKYTELL